MAKLYIAYGSNLYKKQMRQRCPSAKPLGSFILEDARLVFRVFADVEYSPGDKVQCGLWMINRQDERNLDIYEGVGSKAYFKNEDILISYAGGKPQRALIYLMRSNGIQRPTDEYYQTILRGYKDFDLDVSFLEAARDHAYLNKDPDEYTRTRRERQKKDARQKKLVTMPEDIVRKKLDQSRALSWETAQEAAEG